MYRLTSEGERELITWLRELLANPARDSIQFVAALSFLGHLQTEDVLEQLRGRTALLESEIQSLDAALTELKPRLGRLLVLEAEYQRTMRQAELAWVRSLIDDIRRGDVSWKPEAFFSRITS